MQNNSTMFSWRHFAHWKRVARPRVDIVFSVTLCGHGEHAVVIWGGVKMLGDVSHDPDC